jgi:hypothetical protein
MPRVMLERPDYFQKLVDLGCDPDTLGTVTWNHVTHAVDVSGSVHLHNKGLTRLPFQFGKIGEDFWCSGNQLTSLKGVPKEVGRNFGCSNNWLTSLEGAPEKVGGVFGCSADYLTDVSALRGCKINGGIYLFGPKADQDRVRKLLRAQGFKGKILALLEPNP